jgi:hypothetical protein
MAAGSAFPQDWQNAPATESAPQWGQVTWFMSNASLVELNFERRVRL